ncbi:MAG TPA: LysR family transcriptional regulator [Jatrophihabitans sp.]|uniref:LysR family transcriptional regulator n=1 Tax=Jatrophihabitans sp. TaxID=1932789 RepID=UPI002EFDA37C
MKSGDDPTGHQLRLLLVLAEELHFGRAANRLYLTQPALSQQIRSLEQRLGVQLFTRTSRQVELTKHGQELLPYVKDAVDAGHALRHAAHRAAAGSGKLRLGVCESFGALPVTRKVIAAVTAQHPELGPEVHVADDVVEQFAMLSEGEIDAAFVHLPAPEGMHDQVLTTEPRLACVAVSDPLAARDVVSLAELSHHLIVSLVSEEFPVRRGFWSGDPWPDGTTVRYSDQQVTRFETLLSTVSLGGAIAFVPASAATLYPRPDVRYLPVEDLQECAYGVVWHSADHDKPKILALAEVSRQVQDV